MIHPVLVERPNQGQFVIQSTGINPSLLTLNVPRNYEQEIPIEVTTGEGTNLTNVRMVYDALDQPGGVFDAGIQVTLPAPLAAMVEKQAAKLPLKIWGDNTANQAGTVILKVVSDETPVGTLRINTSFSQAVPVLFFTPNFIETGVALDDTVSETLTLENRGLTDMLDVTLQLLDSTGTAPAPAWLNIISSTDLGSLAVGAKALVNLTASPPNTVTEGVKTFLLRVTASNHATTDINVFVSVTQSGIGNVLFHTADMFTFTLDQNNTPIPGLAGARVRVQNEAVISVEQTLVTDVNGEALFLTLPAGNYRYRASAPDHEDTLGRFKIKPGLTGSQDIFLKNNLVTVEWSVTEITLDDTYEIVLSATFETDVPAAVVTIEPVSATLPDMQPGDVFYGEFTLTNHGLIRADNVTTDFPSEDAFFRYEFLGEVPDSIGAKERVTIPYRVINLTAIDPTVDDGGASGGGCFSYQQHARVVYDYTCAWGDVTGTARTVTWTTRVPTGSCGGPGGGGGGARWWAPGGVGPGGRSGNPEYRTPIPGAKCLPNPEGSDDCGAPGESAP